MGADPGRGLEKGSAETWRACSSLPGPRGQQAVVFVAWDEWEQEESLPALGRLLSILWEGQS